MSGTAYQSRTSDSASGSKLAINGVSTLSSVGDSLLTAVGIGVVRFWGRFGLCQVEERSPTGVANGEHVEQSCHHGVNRGDLPAERHVVLPLLDFPLMEHRALAFAVV